MPLVTLLTIPEAAERLAVSRDTIYRLIASGDLRSVHLGRAHRIPADEVDRLIADRLASAEVAQ